MQHTLTDLLLIDALHQTLLNPCASYRWHRLLTLAQESDNRELRLMLENTLAQHFPADGIAGFFKATFLAALTNHPSYRAEAGQIALNILPLDADRLMAFCLFEWGCEVGKGGARSDFIAALCNAKLPELVAKTGAHLAKSAGYLPAREILQVAKVALIVPSIGNETHPPTITALHQARLLHGLGIEVHIFSAQESHILHMPDYLSSQGNVVNTPPDFTHLQALVPPNSQITLGDTRFSLLRRWQDLVTAIAGFDPDLVFLVGLYSPLLTPLYATRPVLSLNIHAMQAMAPADIWLTSTPALADLADLHHSVWGPAIPPAIGHYHPYRVCLKPLTQTRTRAQLGLTENDLVLITAGGRLGQEISGPWAQHMLQLLAQHPQLVWLLVGDLGQLPPALASQAANPQIRLLAHQADLRSVLRCCDIYLNPVRIGGGFSVAEAMAEGLPTLALADSDGGDKLGPSAPKHLNDYFTQLAALIADAGLRQSTGAMLRDRFFTLLDLDSAGPSLHTACQQALRHFRLRSQNHADSV